MTVTVDASDTVDIAWTYAPPIRREAIDLPSKPRPRTRLAGPY
ncbi:hypothetical protein [Embleya sp. NBC_00896]|nr:hypothetical protein OG928_40850 [Embleya sp. NBC_00896]